MNEQDRAAFNLGTLVTGLLQDLRAQASGTPSPEPEREAQPVAGVRQVQQIEAVVRAENDQVRAQLTAQYKARTDALKAVVEQRQRRLEAFAVRQRQAVPAQEGKFILAGRITETASGFGLPNVRVRTFDRDRKIDVLARETRTDALGYYRIEFNKADIEGLGKRRPYTFIEVLDSDDKAIFTSNESFLGKVGQSKFVAASVSGSKVPESLALGSKINRSVKLQQKDFERRGRVFELRADVRLEEEVRRAPVADSTVTRVTLSRLIGSLTSAAPTKAKLPEEKARPPRGTIGDAKEEQPARQPSSELKPVLDKVEEESQKTPKTTPKRPLSPEKPTTGEIEVEVDANTKAGKAKTTRDSLGISVSKVKGIGSTFASRLENEDITDASKLAKVKPARLAKVLKVGLKQARKIVDEAQRVVKKGKK